MNPTADPFADTLARPQYTDDDFDFAVNLPQTEAKEYLLEYVRSLKPGETVNTHSPRCYVWTLIGYASSLFTDAEVSEINSFCDANSKQVLADLVAEFRDESPRRGAK